MFRTEEGDQINSRCLAKRIDRACPFTVNARGVGEQPHAFTDRVIESTGLKYIDPEHDRVWNSAARRGVDHGCRTTRCA